ncbi:uncharacterized protein LOC132543173 [Ylistrum balloti]|uniref:uncharacterized protein LOC132543173 n=1 Tax=Ylistrum balloti TaxID=509963 RepID=UPI002905B6C2|nr:uncharacterized protein LOC132543173 [Ylistrum balloti]
MSDNIRQFEMWLHARDDSIRRLGELSDELDTMQKWFNYSKIVSTTGSIVSGVGAIACFAMSGVTCGLSTGLGLALAGTSVGSAVTSGGASIGKYFHEKHLLQKVQSALERDLSQSVLINERISREQELRDQYGRQSTGNTAVKVFTDYAVTNGVRMGPINLFTENFAKRLARAGILLNVLILPLDIIILVETSVETYNGSTNVVASRIRQIVQELENERDMLLKALLQ